MRTTLAVISSPTKDIICPINVQIPSLFMVPKQLMSIPSEGIQLVKGRGKRTDTEEVK